MIKRINSLGRKRIPANCIAITISDGDPRTFSASFDLPEHGWPGDAFVVMEAMCAGSTIVKRFSCGTLQTPKFPSSVPLLDLTGKNVFFCLKVIDQSEKYGRLLGVAEHVRPIGDHAMANDGRRGILPVETVDLGQQLWRLDYRDHEVFLLVNQNVPGLTERVRSDPMVYALVYPVILRQVLLEAIESSPDDEDTDRWPQLWLSFGRILHPSNSPAPTTHDKEEIEAWIEEVVRCFCEQHKLSDQFSKSISKYDIEER